MSLIEVKDLAKSYEGLKAVDGVSFAVDKGEIFGILGPNGAGKTTTMEMVEALRPIDSGSVLIKGLDVAKNAHKVKQMIGIQLQSTSLFDYLTVAETIDLFASFYHRSVDITEILDEVSLTDKADAFFPSLSGGQKQRVSVALALVNDPEAVFLDEPTTGLDPQARRHLWDVVEATRQKGKSIVLTTHYMEEAETLCDRIAIMDHGKIIEIGTPHELITKLAGDSAIEFSAKELPSKKVEAISTVKGLKSTENRHLVFTTRPQETIIELMTLSKNTGFDVYDLQIRSGTLEDVFINLTGRRLRD
ncbi:MAG: ABC transporter ATP-binding protein [Actinobacteria bacterium]|nr:MAG: ABC transporter ATP-binding protein [Actinomycetota bacterium]